MVGTHDNSAVPGFPFAAVVGQDQLKLALILAAVSPQIGGVLIRGDKGTAKSTAVRGLGAVLAHEGRGGVVELPIGATEDRVIGSLDLQRALTVGEKAFTPGVLADAHGRILYVDEVNLLADHLVDVLLDAAAMGRVHVERDSISHSYRADFVLVGTMNPEEGELRPQLLDRFGLAVDVSAPTHVDTRVEVIERRMAYNADAESFCRDYDDADSSLAQQISHARARLADVQLPTGELRRIAALCTELGVEGLRGDIVVALTARAHAAWRGADEVNEIDVRRAAELALPHRRRRDPFDEPGVPQNEMDEALERASDHVDPDPDPDPPEPDGPGGGEQPGDAPDSDASGDNASSDAPQQDSPPGAATPSGRNASARARLTVAGTGSGASGRRSESDSRHGHAVRAAQRGYGLHLVGSILAAARDHAGDGGVRVSGEHVRMAQRRGREGNLIVFVLDVSGSMAARRRISVVLDNCIAILRDAYQRRDRVAVVTMRGSQAHVAVPPTRSVDVAVRRLQHITTGGRTPIAEGLLTAREVIATARRADPDRRPLMVVLTDGRATSGADAVARSNQAADLLRAEQVSSVVVDCEQGMVRLGMAGALAQRLGAQVIDLEDIVQQAVPRAVGIA